MMYLETLSGVTQFGPNILLKKIFAFILGIFLFHILLGIAVSAVRALIILICSIFRALIKSIICK